MANVLSLALKINADASGLKLDPVERALRRLGEETDKVSGIFDRFASTSEAAAKAQADTSKALQDLIAARKEGTISAQEFAEGFERIRDSATQEAAALQRAAQITEANLTPLERFTREQAELNQQLQAGRISLETYERAVQGAARGLTDAQRAAAGLASQQKSIDGSAQRTTLRFSELSGTLAAIPGPIGNIAGRLSGLASSAQGLSRIFSGGLTPSVAGLSGGFAAAAGPIGIAVAALAAIVTVGRLVGQSLVELEARIERLSRLATQLGVSLQFAQILEESANRADVSVQQLSGSFARLQTTLASATEDGQKAAQALGRLGISLDEFNDLSQQEQILLVGERLRAIEDPAQRSAAAIALFGRSGVELLPFFAEIPTAAEDIERFGRAVSDLEAERLAEFGLGVDRLKLATDGIQTSLTLPFTGLGEGIATGVAEWISGIQAVVDPIGRLLEPALTQLGRSFQALGTFIATGWRVVGAFLEPIANLFSKISEVLGPVLDAVYAFFQTLADGVVQVAEFIASFSPLNLVVDLITYVSESFQPLTDAIGFVQETVSRVVAIVQAVFERLVEFFRRTVGALIERVQRLITAFLEWSGLGEAISRVNQAIAAAFQFLYDALVANLDAISRFIDESLTFLEKWLEIKDELEEPVTPEVDFSQAAVALEGDLAKAQESVAEFGNAGAQAFFRYNEELQDIRDLTAEGFYNGEEEARAIAQATAEFERQRDVLRQQADEQRRAAEEAARRAQAQADAVQRVIDASQEQLRLQEEFGGDSARMEAADNLLVLQEEILRIENALAEARAAGDQAAIDALTARLATLDQVAAREADIASGASARAAELERNAERQRQRDEQESQREFERLKDQERRAAEQRRQQEERINEQIQAARERLFEAQFEIERDRALELAQIRTGSVEIADLRSGGISAFFDTLREDPAIEEARKQRKELEQIRKEIAKLNAERVDILAGNG